MSYPLYNPYATGNQSSTQGQYGLPSIQTETDPRRASDLGFGTTFSSSGASSAIPGNTGGMLPSPMSQSMSYRPEQSRAIMDKDIERSVNMHISRAREEVSVLGKPIHQPRDQGTGFTSTQRDEFRSTGAGMASYPMSSTSASLGHRPSDADSGSSSLDWLSNYKRPTADDSKFYSSVPSKYASGGDSRFNASSERQHDVQSIPGLGDYDYPVQDKAAAPKESSRPKYTSESAANILLRFGLEKEDLEYLISYPEDQITPANLPFILRQIRIQKAKRATTAEQSKPYLEPQPTRSMSGMDSHSCSSSGGTGMRQEEMSSSVLQPSKVIDYGHTGKYTGGVGDIGRISGSRANSGGSGSMLLMDTYDSGRQSQELLQKNTTVGKSSALGSSYEQTRSATSLSISYTSILKSVAPPNHDQTKQLHTQSKQTSQTIPGSFSLPKKDTDMRVFKSEAFRPVPLKEPETDRQSTSKTQPPSTLLHGVHPSRPGLVLIGNNDNSGTKDQSKTQGQGSTVLEQMKKQQPMQKQPMQPMRKQPVQQMQKQPKEQQSKQQKQQVQQQQNQPVEQMGQAIPSITVASQAVRRPMLITGDPHPNIIPPAQPRPIPALMNLNSVMLPTSNRQPSAKTGVFKGLPTPAMMQDYAATSPRVFPHTCSLCSKEFTHMKDWLSHQNTSLHLENCRYLRKQYPEWDGEIALGPRAAGKVAKPSTSTSAQPSQHRNQKTRHGSRSRSRSPSPRRYRGPEGRREKRSSRSRSPPSARYTRRSRSRSRSPRYDRPTASRYRSRSWSPGRRPLQRRRDEKRSSPRRNDDRRPSPRRCRERRSSPKRSDERRLPPRRSREMQSSTEGSSPQRNKSSSAERLAKQLLDTSAIQSLSEQSDLETMVKTLAPVILAELVKMKAPSSSSKVKKKVLTSKPFKAKPSLQKSEASSSSTAKSGKSSSPTMVKLQGIYSSLLHSDVVAAVEQFGKTKSVVLSRSRQEAIVHFEKEEDAKKLKSAKSFDVKGMAVTVVREKESVSVEQKKLSQKKPATSSVSTPQTTKSPTTSTTRKVLLPAANMPLLKGPLSSGAKKATIGRPTNQMIAAKGLIKGQTAVTKAKVLISKAKSVSTKQIAKVVKTGKLPVKGAVKKVAVKKKTCSGSKYMAPGNQPDAGDSKQKPIPEKSEISVKESVVTLKETAKVDKPANRTVTKPTKGKEMVTESNVLAFKAATASTTQKPKTPVDKLAAAGAVAKEKVEETAPKAVSVPSKSTCSENRPDEENSRSKESEAKVQEAVVVPEDKAEVDKLANRTVTKPTKGKEIITEAKVLASKAATASTAQKPETPVHKLAAAGAVAKEMVEETALRAVSVPSKSTASENWPDEENSKPKESETKVQEAVEVLKEKAEVDKSANKTGTKPTKGKEIITEANVLAFKAATASTTQEPKTPVDKLAAAGAVTKEMVEETAAKAVSVPSKSTVSENRPDEENSRSKESEAKVQEAVVVPEDKAEVDKLANRTVTKPTKGKEIITEAKVLAFKAATTLTTQEPETPADKLATEQAVTKEKVEETALKAVGVPSKSTASENWPDEENSKPKESETKVQEAVEVLKDKAEAVETANVTVFELKHQAKLDKANDAEDTDPMQLGETGLEVAEPMEVEGCDGSNEKKASTTEAVPENSADKPSERQPPASTVETWPTETRTLPHVQQSTLSEPASTGQGRETKTEASQMQQQAARSPTEAAVQDPVTAVKTQTNAASVKDASVTTEATAVAVSKQLPEASTASSTAVIPLTVGEMIEKHLYQGRINCLNRRTCLSPKFFRLGKKVLLINKLPEFYDGCYTEEDVAKLLMPFGFQYVDDNIYVIPQMCMAFVQMQTVGNTHNIMKVSTCDGIFFKGCRLAFHVVDGGIGMSPFGFYKSLMKQMNSPVEDDGVRTIFIKNISPSEVRDLRETLKNIGSVRNCLPLLNKVFIEFESVHDADWLGVWYSLLKQTPGYEVCRLTVPYSNHTSPPPRLPENALPDNKDVVPGATIPPITSGIPQDSMAPFWVTMRTSPFLFPTMSPWFIIPDYLTVRGMNDIEKASGHGSRSPTVMLTGLPWGSYKHEDVAKLVWRYFPKQNLRSLYYNVTVLPLQRRAFVYFADWTTCCKFVRDYTTNPVSVKGFKLSVHFVLQHMNPESSEEMMYETLMKWSNTGVPEPKSLEDRLLCVETSETSVDIIRMVMEVVASIATFVNFLPLANRICIEMADSSAVTQVLEKYNIFPPDLDQKKRAAWSKVQRFETSKSLKQRLHDSSENIINFEPETINVEAKPPALKCQTQPPPSELSDNGSQPALHASDPAASTISEPIASGPSATTTSNVAMKEDGEKPGTENTMDSSFGPEANEDVEKVKGEEGSPITSVSTAVVTSTSAVSSGNTVPAASSPAPSGAVLRSEENFAELPQINTEIFKVLTAAVRQHRLTRGSGSQSEKESPSKNTSSTAVMAEDTPQRMGQDDCTDDIVSSDTCHFDEQKFNMDDFVTIDEIGDEDDMEDTKPEPDSSSSSSSRARRERQSPSVSSGSKQTSTRSSKDSKSSASFSPSSKSTKGSSSSNSSSVSPKKSADSSELTKSPTKPSSSATVSKPSSSSSPLSAETPSSNGQKTQQSRTKSPAKASNTRSSGCSTRLSSAICEREKITSPATVEASIDIHLEPLREEQKNTEGAVAMFDHKGTAEGIAAKTAESETNIKTSSEMHPFSQGRGVELSQAQSLDIDVNVSKHKDQKKSKEEEKGDDVGKHRDKEDDNGGNYQILDSLDDQTDEQMHVEDQDSSSETQRTGLEESQTLHEESCQISDSVDDRNKGRQEEYSEIEMDNSFQVLDSVTEDQAATSQGDSHLVQDDSSTARQLSEEDKIPVVGKYADKFAANNTIGKNREINNKDNVQVLEAYSKQAPRGKGDGKKKRQNEEEVKGKMPHQDSYKASKDIENPDGQIPNEDQPLQEGDNKDNLKDPDSDVTEQETFEILDSIDDQTATEDDHQKLETPSDQISKEHWPEKEDIYQVIDSLEGKPTTTETESESDKKGKRIKKGEATPRKDDGPSKTSGPTNTAFKSKEEEKSPKKQDRTIKKYETRTKMNTSAGDCEKEKEIKETAEEMVYEIVDAVEDESVQDATTTERSSRRRSARGKKEDKIAMNLKEVFQKHVGDEEAAYEILDSVEDETANNEPTVLTRSTRGIREKTNKAASSSKATKGSSSSNSCYVSPKDSTDSHELTKSLMKPSSSASISKPSYSSSPVSTETPSSPGQKTQQSRTKSPAKASTTRSSNCSTRLSSAARDRKKIMSAASVKAPMESHQEPLKEEAKVTEVTVAKSEHKVSAEGIASKTAESETNMATSLEMHPPPQEHGVELSQAQSLNIDFNVTALKDQKKSKEEGKEDDVDKYTEEEEDDGENYQILDSLNDQTDEHMEDGDQDGSSETQQTAPEDGHTLHEKSYQVLDSVNNEGKAHPGEYSEMEMDSSFQVLDSVTEDQAAASQEDSQLVQDDSSKVKQLSEEEAIPVVKNSDAVGKDEETNTKDNFQVLDTGSKQAPRSRGDGKKKKQKEGKIPSVESCKSSKDVENPDGRIPNEDWPLQEHDIKDTLEDPESDVTEQETFEILDSIDDQTAAEDDCQKLDTPSEQISKEHIWPIEEKEDTYQVIDSLEDEPMTTETESESNRKGERIKKGEVTPRKDDRPSRSSSPLNRASKSKEKEKSPKKQDRTVKKYETRIKMDTTVGVCEKEKKIKETTDEMLYEIVDSTEVEPVQDAATTERFSRRRSARGKKEDKIALNLTEASQKHVRDEEAAYEILDSVEDETADDESTVTRSTRGKRERTGSRKAASSSKSTKSSSTSSVSPKRSTDTSEPSKSPTKFSSSTSVSKPSSSSSPLSTETPSSPGQKTQHSRIKPLAEASNTRSSGCCTHLSSATCEREKITSTATVEASIDFYPETLREEQKDIESAVAKSDHAVSAEGIAAKTETKIKTSSEMHPPTQEHEVELIQTQDGNSETQQTEPEEGQTLHEVSYQVLDIVNNEGNAHPEECSEMEMDSSIQVLDSATKDQAATSPEDSNLVQDDNSKVKQLSEEDAIPVVDNSDVAVKDAVGKYEETNKKDNFQVLDTGSKRAPRSTGDGKKKKQKEEEVKGKIPSVESCKSSKDVENPDGQIPNEDWPLQEHDIRDTLEDPESDVTEQETFEILDSIDDQTAKEDDCQKLDTPSDQISKEHIQPIEGKEDSYQVIDSLEDGPMIKETKSETDKKEKRTKTREVTAKKDDGSSKMSGPITKSEEKEKSPKKQDRTVKKYETRTKMDTTAGVSEKDTQIQEETEEMVYQIVDSVEDEQVQDATTRERSSRRRSARGKKEDKITLNRTEAFQKHVRDEEPTYEVLDAVEDEPADDEPTITTRSTRGRRERTSKKDSSNEKGRKEDSPTRRRHTHARESQERHRGKTNKEEKAPPKEGTPTKKSDIVVREASEDAACKIFDSVEHKIVEDDRPTIGQKGKRGRPKKEVKITKEENITLKKDDKELFREVADEEEVTYQILDSVEDETVDDQPPTGQPGSSKKENIFNNDKQTQSSTSPMGSLKNEEEEEMYEIIDSLEDDQEELTATEVSDRGSEEKSIETTLKVASSTEKGDTPTCGTTVMGVSKKVIVNEESLYEIVDDLEEVNDDPSAAGSGTGNDKSRSKTDNKKQGKSTTKSQSDTATPEEEQKQTSPEKHDTTCILVKLDEVSEEEEDYPDDTVEEEELRQRQAATKEKQFAKERQSRRTREREERRAREREEKEREQRSQSGSSRGGGDRGGTRRAKEKGRGNEEKVEVDTKEMVTLDEVGADEAGETRAPESQEWDGEITEGELQTLVTLDEFVEEEEEGTAEQSTLETCPLHQEEEEEETVDSLNPEMLVTLDEAGDDEEEKPDEEQAAKTSGSAKRKHNEDTGESINFVTVDEVGEVEEEEEMVTTRTRGQAKKRPRQTPVRKSNREKKVRAKDEREEEKDPADVLPPTSLTASSSLGKDPSTLSSDGQPEVQKTEVVVEAASEADVCAASVGQELQPERPENQTLEGGEEEKGGRSRADIKVACKQRREPVGPEAKRSRSQSPCVAADFKLPPFKPNNPLGQDFMLPAYFCKLCSVFCMCDSKDLHCSGQTHYDNLQKHYEKLE